MKETLKIWDVFQPDYAKHYGPETTIRVQNKKIKKFYLFKQVLPKVQHLK